VFRDTASGARADRPQLRRALAELATGDVLFVRGLSLLHKEVYRIVVMPLDLSQFKLQRVVIEIRYEPAFLLWDNAGTICFTLRNKFPALKLTVPAQPNQQIMSLDENLESVTGLERTYLAGTFPRPDMEAFRKAADTYFSHVIAQLSISDLSRVGLGLLYTKSFESRQQSAEFIVACKPSFQREGNFFNVEGEKMLDPECFIRWEGDTIGCSAKLSAIEQRIDVNIPHDFHDLKPISRTRNAVMLDVDYYAHAGMPTSKFKASALIENWSRIVRRDVGGFVGT
jgi:hypothetical protein